MHEIYTQAVNPTHENSMNGENRNIESEKKFALGKEPHPDLPTLHSLCTT